MNLKRLFLAIFGFKTKVLVLVASVLCSLSFAGRLSAQAVSGTITGLVTDPSGAVIPGVAMTATDVATGITHTATTGSEGTYSFPQLPIGTYTVTAARSGFQSVKNTGIVLAVGQIYTLNIKMQISSVANTVTVTEAAPIQVQTKNTQLGTVITGAQISSLPLITRNVLDLMQTEPGVMASSDRFGTNSVNGSQTQQNSYLVNGTDFNDLPLNTPLTGTLPPNPDAIQEFSVITNTINPEYGRNSGAIVNQVIKSGTNSFHGGASEYYRDTFLNSRSFFQPSATVFHRHIFDGFLGGPIIKNHLFGFFSYEGLRQRAPQITSVQTVFTSAERTGDFSTAGVNFATGHCPFNSTLTACAPIPLFGDSGSGCTVSGGTPCAAGTTYQQLFGTTGVIPTQDLNTVSLALVNKFVPLPNLGTTGFSFNPVVVGSANQELFRVDYTLGAKDSFWGFGYIERAPTTDTLPFTGASLPGFAEVDNRSISQYTVAWDHVFSANTVNEMRGGYSRFNFAAVNPQTPTLPSSVGFQITPQDPAGAGLPVIGITGMFTLGFSNNGPQPRIDQTYQADDNFTHIFGKHTLKFGFDMRRYHVTNPFFFENSGNFSFGGNGPFSTGNPGIDFLLGTPDSYGQSGGGFVDATAQSYYSYVQDQYAMRSDLTINYGIGWQINTPFTDHFNNNRAIVCFRPGQQSFVFPTAPTGLVYPGDANCSASGYKTGFTHFGPRLGIAWSPDLGWFSGGEGNFSIRAGGGVYFNQAEEELTLQNLITPPFNLIDSGITDVGGNPSFIAPFSDVQCVNQTGAPIAGCAPVNGNPGSIANKYPFTPPAAGSNVNFAPFEPFSLNVISPNFSVPYSVNYNLTVQRQFPGRAILSVGYVGSEGRHLERAYELNPIINPQACAADPSCLGLRPFQNFSPVAQGEVAPLLPFSSLGQQTTDGNSHYNGLQVSLQKATSHGLNFLVAYTYSHSIDNGSSFENSGFGARGTNTLLPGLNIGDSAFDARHRLVLSYGYQIPVPASLTDNAFAGRVLKGWRIGGITTAQTGFPITISDTGFRSLTCSAFTFYGCPDTPNVVGPLNITSNIRTATNHDYFSPAAFAKEPFGTFGNEGRNNFHGPGIWDTDFALFKDTKITEQTELELRIDAQNVFNHAQFSNPVSDINSGLFGQVRSAGPGRVVQLGARFMF
jgi:hypothetical protein